MGNSMEMYFAGLNFRIVRVRAGVDRDIAGAGGIVPHALRERAVMVRNPAGAGGSGIKKSVPRRALPHTLTRCQ